MKSVYKKTIEFAEDVPPIILKLFRAEQETVWDSAQVVAAIFLPADSQGELHFLLRNPDVAVNWEFLTPNWGNPRTIGGQPYRYARHIFSAPTWSEAERPAMEWLFVTVLPLLVELAGRCPKIARGICRTANPQAIWEVF